MLRTDDAQYELAPRAHCVAATWHELPVLVDAARERGAMLLMPWCDAVGAVGFFCAPRTVEAGPSSLPALGVAIASLAVPAGLAHGLHAPFQFPGEPLVGDASHGGKLEVTGSERGGDAGPGPVVELTVAGARAALENCTYCPKLCRFACPVATVSGNESLTPRQLMLTVNLHRRGMRALDDTAAERLWACTDCRACMTFCDHGNDVATVLQAVRAELWEAGVRPAAVRRHLEDVEQGWAGGGGDGVGVGGSGVGVGGSGVGGGRSVAGGSPMGMHASRALLAAALGADLDRSSVTGLLLGPGARGEDAHEVLAARGALAIARQRFGSVSWVDLPQVFDAGAALWRWGDRRGFARHARRFAAQLRHLERVVVDEPEMAYALAVLYRRVDVTVPEVVTVTSLLRGAAPRLHLHATDVPHDDAFAVRWLGEDTLRVLCGQMEARLRAGGRGSAHIPESGSELGSEHCCEVRGGSGSGVGVGGSGVGGSGVGGGGSDSGNGALGSVLEGQGECCGGSLLKRLDPELARAVARAAADDLLEGGAQRIVTASPSCARTLRRVGAHAIAASALWFQLPKP